MDIAPLDGVDITHDMNITPWLTTDSPFKEIVFDDVLEHSKNLLGILEKAYRIGKDGCVVKISVPHYSTDNMYTVPTNTTFFSSRIFNYFDKSLDYKYSFYFQDVKFIIDKAHLSFKEYFTYDGKKPVFNPFKWIRLEWLINKNSRNYERFFCRILPIGEIYYELRIKKRTAV